MVYMPYVYLFQLTCYVKNLLSCPLLTPYSLITGKHLIVQMPKLSI